MVTILFAFGLLLVDRIALGDEAGPYTVAKEIKARAEFNPVFRGESVSLPDGEVFFVAEIPRGEVRKFEMRTATGQVIVDRTLCPRLVPGTQRRVDAVPATYGFSAGRFNVDGDPLDLLVLGREDLYRRNDPGESCRTPKGPYRGHLADGGVPSRPVHGRGVGERLENPGGRSRRS